MQIAAILLIAATLRLQYITQPLVDAFSWRQASTAMIADNFYRTNWNIFFPEVNWTGPGPSYQGREFQTVTYIAALLYLPAGQHDWIGRGVAIAFGLWGTFALYQLVRLVWDEQRALITAAVMALLPGSIFIERSFLPDPAMVALVVTSFWMLVLYLQTDRLRYLFLAAAIGSWGFLTKIPGLIIGLPMIYATLVILRGRGMLHPKRLIIMGSVALFALVPVITYYLWAKQLASSYPPHHFAGDGNWLWNAGIARWWDQKYFLPLLKQRFYGWLWTPPVIALVLGGLCFPPRVQADTQIESSQRSSVNDTTKAPWLFHWWLLGGLVFYLIGAKELVDNPWNFHIINPAAAALAGHAIVSIGYLMTRMVRVNYSVITTTALLLIIFIFGQQGLQYMYTPYAYESHQLGLALREVSQPDDLVVTMANDLGDPVAIYYSGRRGWVFPPASPESSWHQLPESDNEAILLFEELRASGADWLGVVSEQQTYIRQYHPDFVDYIDRVCETKIETSKYVVCRIMPVQNTR
ncbi:MAG: glycosyltransferase family 39 protein [Chloroflexota bacterium]|nr:glycosyltransferase family 39 protein [Chloroflexota bacterium]